jgi:hypothetical protein
MRLWGKVMRGSLLVFAAAFVGVGLFEPKARGVSLGRPEKRHIDRSTHRGQVRGNDVRVRLRILVRCDTFTRDIVVVRP